MSSLLSSNGTLTIVNQHVPVILHQPSKKIVRVDCIDMTFAYLYIHLNIDCFSNKDKSFASQGRLHESACPHGSRCTLSSTLRETKTKEEIKKTIDISDNGVVVASLSFDFQPNA
jgi:hypothetical protein